MQERQEEENQRQKLYKKFRKQMKNLMKLQKTLQDQKVLEKAMTCYYAKDWRVYQIQTQTEKIIGILRSLSNLEMNSDFMNIVFEGTNKSFSMSALGRWDYEVEPILEAYMHASYMLDMAVKYGKTDHEGLLDSGWAALLYIYRLR